MQNGPEIPLSEIGADALPRDRTVTKATPVAELEHPFATAGLRQPIDVWELRNLRPFPLRADLGPSPPDGLPGAGARHHPRLPARPVPDPRGDGRHGRGK